MASLCRWLIAAGIGVVLTSVTFAADEAALVQRLHNAAESSSIDDPALKPWHLKLTFQLFDKKGALAEEGTIEEWWYGGNDKRVYTSPSYTATEIRREKDLYRTAGQPSAPYILDLLRAEVVHPLANDAEVKDSVPDQRVESFGKVKLDCIMLDHKIKNVAYPPLGLFPTYCLDQDQDRLRVSFRYGAENVTRNTIGRFQGRGIPIDTVVYLSGVTAAKAHVAALSTMAAADHDFDPGSSLQLQNAAPVMASGGVTAGRKISGAVPVYPIEDKQSHTSGSVHLHAVIGTDGRIHQLSVIDAPSATMAISALTAVRTWVYKPYLLNGLPCSVETTITVNYNFGPG
jgi:TonB family protein